MLKFNMGCGQNRRAGFINVDAAAASQPDEVVDLEATPWPWPDNCADEVWFVHSLEHMGADAKVFLAIMIELYRICAPGARLCTNTSAQVRSASRITRPSADLRSSVTDSFERLSHTK